MGEEFIIRAITSAVESQASLKRPIIIRYMMWPRARIQYAIITLTANLTAILEELYAYA